MSIQQRGVEAGRPEVVVRIAGGEHQAMQYSIDDDVLSLGNVAAVTLANLEGELAGKITMGMPVEIVMADPSVASGAKSTRLKGRVTRSESRSDARSGSVVTVTAADLGWHLQSTAGKPWTNLKGISFQKLLESVLDPSWGFAGVRAGNDTNRKLNQGRRGIQIAHMPHVGAVIPPIWIEPGQMIADVLIEYARREKVLLNVTSDGWLQFWQPVYNTGASYEFWYYGTASGESKRKNNVKDASLQQTIDGMYSVVECIYTNVIPSEITSKGTNPLEGYHLKKHTPTTNPLPFNRRCTFSDSEPINEPTGLDRAKWKWQRGMYDSWTYTVTVEGHSQGGIYFAPDTMASVTDAVNGIKQALYVSAVRLSRTKSDGTIATITMKQPDLLRA